jgi:hypothetical protein
VTSWQISQHQTQTTSIVLDAEVKQENLVLIVAILLLLLLDQCCCSYLREGEKVREERETFALGHPRRSIRLSQFHCETPALLLLH